MKANKPEPLAPIIERLRTRTRLPLDWSAMHEWMCKATGQRLERWWWWLGVIAKHNAVDMLEWKLSYIQDCPNYVKGLGALRYPGGYLESELQAWAARNGYECPPKRGVRR